MLDLVRARNEESPSVILITESAFCGSQHDAQRTAMEEDYFLSSWEFCHEKARLSVIDNSSSFSNIEASMAHLAEGLSFNTPALLVMNVPSNSFASSNIQIIRKLCNQYNFFFCIEGPGLAMLGQLSVPSDPSDCLNQADVLIVDLPSWFGIGGCSVVSFQNNLNEQVAPMRFPQLLPPTFTLENLNEALIPTVKSWTVLSKLGVENIRSMVDEITSMSETFVFVLGNSSNLKISYEGVGCAVRISYKPQSTGNRDSNLRMINRAILANVEEDARKLNVLAGECGDDSFYQFSPIRLLSGNFMPSLSDVKDFSTALQSNADKFDTCKIGRAAFVSRVTSCTNIVMIEESEATGNSYLSFGCFRVVPAAFHGTWKDCPTQKNHVGFLTKALASELCVKLKHSAETQETTVDGSQPGDNQGGLPFVFYFHSGMDEVTSFVSAEPRVAVSPKESVEHSQAAAEFILSAVRQVVAKWNQDPESLHVELPVPNALAQIVPSPASGISVGRESIFSWFWPKKDSSEIKTSDRNALSRTPKLLRSQQPDNELCESEDHSASNENKAETLTTWMHSRQSQGPGFSPQKHGMARRSIPEDPDKTHTYVDELPSFMKDIVIGDYGPLDTPHHTEVYVSVRSEVPTPIPQLCKSESEPVTQTDSSPTAFWGVCRQTDGIAVGGRHLNSAQQENIREEPIPTQHLSEPMGLIDLSTDSPSAVHKSDSGETEASPSIYQGTPKMSGTEETRAPATAGQTIPPAVPTQSRSLARASPPHSASGEHSSFYSSSASNMAEKKDPANGEERQKGGNHVERVAQNRAGEAKKKVPFFRNWFSSAQYGNTENEGVCSKPLGDHESDRGGCLTHSDSHSGCELNHGPYDTNEEALTSKGQSTTISSLRKWFDSAKKLITDDLDEDDMMAPTLTEIRRKWEWEKSELERKGQEKPQQSGEVSQSEQMRLEEDSRSISSVQEELPTARSELSWPSSAKVMNDGNEDERHADSTDDVDSAATEQIRIELVKGLDGKGQAVTETTKRDVGEVVSCNDAGGRGSWRGALNWLSRLATPRLGMWRHSSSIQNVSKSKDPHGAEQEEFDSTHLGGSNVSQLSDRLGGQGESPANNRWYGSTYSSSSTDRGTFVVVRSTNGDSSSEEGRFSGSGGNSQDGVVLGDGSSRLDEEGSQSEESSREFGSSETGERSPPTSDYIKYTYAGRVGQMAHYPA